MKAKTRILAMLLTVLMVVGILPLSLFALDGAVPTVDQQAPYEGRTLDEIKTEFGRIGMTLSRYQTFSTLDTDTLTSLQNGSGHAHLGACSDSKGSEIYCDHNDATDGGCFNIVDQKKSGMSIAVEGDGNKALLFSKPANDSKNENYISSKNFGGVENAYHDIYVSLDVKMGGDKMAEATLFRFVYRPSGPAYVEAINVNAAGKLYIGTESNVIGQLSKDSYTRISVATDRANNKYYVYVNDVLTTVGGRQLFSESDANDYNTAKGTTYEPGFIPFDDIRIYVVGDALKSTTEHDGVYVDNLLSGRRWAIRERNTTESVLIQSDFTNAVAGNWVYPNGSLDKTAFGTVGVDRVTGVVNPTSLIYVDDNDDNVVDAIRWTKATQSGQSFIRLDVYSNYCVSFSGDFKMGPDGLVGCGFEHDHNSPNRQQASFLHFENDGTIKAYKQRVDFKDGGVVIGKLSTTEYTNVRFEVVSNGPRAKTGLLVYYINGVLKYIQLITENTEFNVKQDYLYTAGFRPYYTYTNSTPQQYSENELQMKNVEVKLIDDYNNVKQSEHPFATDPHGFYNFDGVLRYYDGKGGYMTEDFFIGSTKYMVSTDGEVLSEVRGLLEKRDLDDIETEFASQNVDINLYQSFENTGLTFTDGVHVYEKSTNANVKMPGNVDVSAYGAYLQYKNYRPSYKIVTEDDGNKSLLFHPSTAVEAGNDCYVNIIPELKTLYSGVLKDGTSVHDFFVSFDVKMDGPNIAACVLLQSVGRGAATAWDQWIRVNEVGGLYVRDYASENLIGFLSQDEYTRIAVSTDRMNGKLYVYLNDVLVTPEGVELFSQGYLDALNKNNNGAYEKFNVHTAIITEFRVYSTDYHASIAEHKGIYFDNILLGSRIPYTNVASATPQSGVTFDIAATDTGVTVPANGAGGVYAPNASSGSMNTAGCSIGTWSKDGMGTIRYVDENNDGKPDAMEVHADKTADTTASAQAYIDINPGFNKGRNTSFVIKVKGGQDGFMSTSLVGFRVDHRAGQWPTMDYYDQLLTVNGSGQLTTLENSRVIGQLSKTEYTEVRIDVICNSIMPIVRIFVGGELKIEYGLGLQYSDAALAEDGKTLGGYSSTDFKPTKIRLFQIYTGDVSKRLDKDLRVSYFSYNTTQAYDGDIATERLSVFENNIAGFFGICGINRYYNGDGTFKTEDFVLDGETWLVGSNGIVTGRESDGREHDTFAPYVNWEHTITPYKSSPTGQAITSIGTTKYDGGNSTIVSDRDGAVRLETSANGDKAAHYISYYDGTQQVKDDGKTWDKNTHAIYGFGGDADNNCDLVFELDLMLGERMVETLRTSSQQLFYLTGFDHATTGGSRKDMGCFYINSDGWILNSSKQTVVKLSTEEYTRISLVIHTPTVDEAANTLTTAPSIDVYVNGVQVDKGIATNAATKRLGEIRFLQCCNADTDLYVKNIYIYKSSMPEQFVSKDTKALTTDQGATPATMADMKTGLVKENGVLRCYSELGLPIIGITTTVGDKTVVTDKYGKVICDGVNHFENDGKGRCSACGEKLDGVTALYGNNLELGSDVRVIFNLDIDADKAKDGKIEIGTESHKEEYAISELETTVVDGKTYYVVGYGVPAKDIGVNITARLINVEGVEGTVYTYSAQTYIDKVAAAEESETVTKELKALCAALDIYGKNAAAVLVNNGEGTQAVAGVNFDGISADGTKDEKGAIKLSKFSLELKSKIKLRVYFTLLTNEANESYAVTANGATANVEKIDTCYYCVDYELTATELDDTVTFVITAGDSSMTVNLSALYYAKVMSGSGKASEAEKNLMNAIKLYSDTAIAYAATL